MVKRLLTQIQFRNLRPDIVAAFRQHQFLVMPFIVRASKGCYKPGAVAVHGKRSEEHTSELQSPA